MLSSWAHWRATDTTPDPAWLLEHPHTPNIRNYPFLCNAVPQTLISLPMLFRGCGEESQLSSSICVVLNPLGLSSTSGPHSPLQCISRTKPLHASSQTTIQTFIGEKHSRTECRYSQQSSTDTTIKRENTTKQIMGKQHPNTTMNPQHTNPTAIARKAHTNQEWKIPNFQSLRERQNATHRTMDAITATISTMEITRQYTVW